VLPGAELGLALQISDLVERVVTEYGVLLGGGRIFRPLLKIWVMMERCGQMLRELNMVDIPGMSKGEREGVPSAK